LNDEVANLEELLAEKEKQLVLVSNALTMSEHMVSILKSNMEESYVINQSIKSELETKEQEIQALKNLLTGQVKQAKDLPVTLEGKLDGQRVQIRGYVYRKGPQEENPPGPCKVCSAMIGQGKTSVMEAQGTWCQYSGQGKVGHIQEYEGELGAKLRSEDFLIKIGNKSEKHGPARNKKCRGGE